MYVGGPAYRCVSTAQIIHIVLLSLDDVPASERLRDSRIPRAPAPAGMHIKTRGDY